MILLFIIQICAMCSIIYQTVTKYGDKNKKIKNKHILRQSAHVLSYQVLSYHQCNSGNTNIVQKTITDKTDGALLRIQIARLHRQQNYRFISRSNNYFIIESFKMRARVCVFFNAFTRSRFSRTPTRLVRP